MKDEARSVRNAARVALLRLERKDAEARSRRAGDVARLIGQLDNRSAPDKDRVKACTLLGLARDPRAVTALRRLCAPKTPDRVRFAAARALVRITGETRGFVAGQPARSREAALRRWATDG